MKVIKAPTDDVYFSVEDVPEEKIAALTAAIRAYRSNHLTELDGVYRHYVYRNSDSIEIDLLISPEHAEALTKIVESFK